MLLEVTERERENERGSLEVKLREIGFVFKVTERQKERREFRR